MMKFFRKHNKKLLAVFMVLLMIVFLGGSAVEGLLQGNAKQVMASSRFGPITNYDFMNARDLTGILDTMQLPWQQPVAGLTKPIETIDWILLSKEAEELGTTVPLHQVQATLADDALIDDLARRLRKKPERILEALAQLNTIRQTVLSVSGVTTPSQAEVNTAIRKVLEKVKVNAVVLPAVAFIDPTLEFSNEQINAHFEKYKEREAAEGLEFGYYVQPKLKVQYIKIDQEKVAQNARIPNLESKARSFYNQNRDTHPMFRRPAEETTAEEGPDAEQTPYLSWEESKDKAVDHIRSEEAKGVTARIADWLTQYASEPWYDAERGDDGYKVAPERTKEPAYYDKIVSNIPKTIGYPEAISTAVTDFFSEAQAESVPELGTAFFVGQRAGVWQTLRTIVFRSQPIIDSVPKAPGTNASDFLALYQTAQYPIRDQAGNTYVLRIVDAQPGHVAESVDEVREQVLSDMRLSQGYNEARARAESLRSCGASVKLRDAYESDEELVGLITSGGYADAGYLEPPSFPRSARFFATSGSSPRPYLGAGIGEIPIEVMEECFELTNREDKHTMFELQDRAAVMVVEWAEIERPEAGTIDEQRKSYIDEMERNRSKDVIASWMDPENIRARNGHSLELN